ncbi:golgin subfamily A member 6-like protein 24 [Paramacrobiotus metropolitanus]|uniref:golgin subfamily A member 6-like protein 24 n=1 Tax=Paramacrobiotus metropolitanus TaxID=2943436 RepID=UPI00244565E7|nr:golgin subfamily A member 6-like protein 24 [Paramacrobiotus metropolitanus]
MCQSGQQRSFLSSSYAQPRFSSTSSPRESCRVQRTIEQEIQTIIDNAQADIQRIESLENDPDRRLSRSMEISLQLWTKLTAIRDKYKSELKQKQDERMTFENDARLQTEQTAKSVADLAAQIASTNEETLKIEKELESAQCYRKKIDDDTKAMEEQIKKLVDEGADAQWQLKKITADVEEAQRALCEAVSGRKERQKRLTWEAACAEAVFQEEVDKKKSEIAATENENRLLEKQLSQSDECNAVQQDIAAAKSELRKLRNENDIIAAEIEDIQVNNEKLRKASAEALREKEKLVQEKEAFKEQEERKMAKERKNQENKLQQQENAIAEIRKQQQNNRMRAQEMESDAKLLENEIEQIKKRCRESEQRLNEASAELQRSKQTENVEREFQRELCQLENKTNQDLRDIRNKVQTLNKQKTDTMEMIRRVCEEIAKMREMIQEAEKMCAPTFRRLRDLTTEYETLKGRNDRASNTIAFYDKIRASENQYVALKSVLSTANARRDFCKHKAYADNVVRAATVNNLDQPCSSRKSQAETSKPFSCLNTNLNRNTIARSSRLDAPEYKCNVR